MGPSKTNNPKIIWITPVIISKRDLDFLGFKIVNTPFLQINQTLLYHISIVKSIKDIEINGASGTIFFLFFNIKILKTA